MTDLSGVTSYTYDYYDRVTQKVTPQGTLNYTWDNMGNPLSLTSNNGEGVWLSYTYDALNRLATVRENRLPNPNTTTYSYDAVGNLQQVVYANGVAHDYTYDALNRLTNLTVHRIAYSDFFGSFPNVPQQSYTYTLGPAGNRTAVTEMNGRQATYAYDDLYRLTSETISCSAAPGCASQLGTIGYQYDAVGNRQSLTSTVAAIASAPAGTLNYDANDRLTSAASEQYDANGNTLVYGSTANVYDFENRLVRRGGVSIVYDGDGNRVRKTVGGVTTEFLVDTNNLTGYAQVVEERVGGVVQRSYTYGLDLLSQRRLVGSGYVMSYYSYDGHGSVRALTARQNADDGRPVTDTYTYDAFGNLLERTGSTPNLYLYAGEQFDPELGLYYNRARYLDVTQGRFWGMDCCEGSDTEPLTLHRYLYANGDPVDKWDPPGTTATNINELSTTTAINEKLETASLQAAREIGKRAIRQVVCEVGEKIAEEAVAEGVYIFMTELAPGLLVPYIGQSGELATRIARHVKEGKIYERIFYVIEVQGGREARRIAEQRVIQVLTKGLGLLKGVRALPDSKRLIANLRNEISLKKFAKICR